MWFQFPFERSTPSPPKRRRVDAPADSQDGRHNIIQQRLLKAKGTDGYKDKVILLQPPSELWYTLKIAELV